MAFLVLTSKKRLWLSSITPGKTMPRTLHLGGDVSLEFLPQVEDPVRPLLEQLDQFYLILPYPVEPRARPLELGHRAVGLQDEGLELLDLAALGIDLVGDEVVLAEGDLGLGVVLGAEDGRRRCPCAPCRGPR